MTTSVITINIFHLADDDALSSFAKESWRSATTLQEPYNFD